MTAMQIEKWDTFEAEFSGPDTGNPFLDVSLEAIFQKGSREVRVPGFYDGNGTYKVRFMPDDEGEWSFKTNSSVKELDGQTGGLTAVAPSPENHGPVHVRNQFHFGYADGTPFFSFGTTCYAWTHQTEEMQDRTLKTLEKAPFNKMRMCVFPKHYPYNSNEPYLPAFMPSADGKGFDYDRPNPEMFQHFDKQILALRDMGLEADIIIFHPYDRWGFSDMTPEQDCNYVAYLTARIAGYRNVWWSLANEYDFLLNTKPMTLWEKFFHTIEENDPYGRLASIHNGDVTMNYNHRKPWVTHSCIQNWDVKKTQDWRNEYGKPVVNDEPEYEGNLIQSWGSISAQELVHRFWITMTRGGYAGHGETYAHPEDEIWWAKGGDLRGEAWQRLGFLRDLLEEDVKSGLEPIGPSNKFPWSRVSGAQDGIDGDVRYIYLGEHQPVVWAAGLPQDNDNYDVDLIDTWNMTVTRIEKKPPIENFPTRHGSEIRARKPDSAFSVELPGKPGLVIRCRRRK